jgi:NADH dehydrogenase/NADH:ubiquinone oxidoreductase subunit G
MQQLIFDTLYRAATPVGGTTEEYATPEDARDAFIAKVMGDLFPGFQMPTEAPVKEKKARKPRSPKKEAEPVPAVVEVPVVAEAPVKEKKARKPKKEAEPVAEAAAEVALPASPEKEKKKRAPMTEEAKAAAKAKREAKKNTNNEVDALATAVAAMTVTEPNLKKMDPTWKKHLKTVAKAQSREVTKELEAELLSYLNRLTKEEFANKKAEEHVGMFLAPQTASNAAAEPAERKEPVDLDIVEFNGQDYFVNPETKRVYEGEGTYDDDTGAWTSYKPVGYVGMLGFAEMKLD